MSVAWQQALFASVLLLACSGVPDAEPRPGGGATGVFDGHLTVFAVDALSGVVLANATVRVDDTSAQTDNEGRADFDVDAYEHIEVSRDAHTERWFGLAAAVVTVPVALGDAPEDGVLTGTLDLQELTPQDPENHLTAVVAASHTAMLDVAPPAAAVACPDAADCSFSISVAPSSRRVFAEVLELDDTDSVVSVRGLFLSAAQAVGAGATATVELLPVEAPIALEVETPSDVGGFDAVVGVPGAALDGAVLLFSEEAMGRTRLLPPGSAVWAVASGRTARGESRSIVRTSSVPASLAAPPLPALPEATLEGARVLLPDGAYRVLRTDAETVRVFDGRTSVPAPLGDSLELEVTDVEMSPVNLSLDAIERDWVHRVRARL